MADSKITALTSLAGSGVDIAADVVPIVDDSAGATKKILASNLLGAAYTAAGDIVQASAAGVAARLGIGTKRQVPTVNSGATALAYANPITLGTEVASTSGTSIDFTSIPSAVRRITVNFKGVSTNGTSSYMIQIGDAGGVETSGYLGASSLMSTGVATTAFTTGFGIRVDTAAGVVHGSVILSLEDSSDFTWEAAGVTARSDDAVTMTTAGTKALSAELDRIRITTVNGTDTFDAGAINISYE